MKPAEVDDARDTRLASRLRHVRRGIPLTAFEIAFGSHAVHEVINNIDPAQRSDGYNPRNLPNAISEGMRFRLDPAVDVK